MNEYFISLVQYSSFAAILWIGYQFMRGTPSRKKYDNPPIRSRIHGINDLPKTPNK
jgi:hypothetical protein